MSRQQEILDYITAELLLDPDDGELAPDDELLMSERIDSLGLMRLIAHLDEAYGVKVPYDEILIENFRSVKTIDAYLASKEPGSVAP
ncbi:MAG: phosphopantetheine-binding protein [Actinomycetota bacterium]